MPRPEDARSSSLVPASGRGTPWWRSATTTVLHGAHVPTVPGRERPVGGLGRAAKKNARHPRRPARRVTGAQLIGG